MMAKYPPHLEMPNDEKLAELAKMHRVTPEQMRSIIQTEIDRRDDLRKLEDSE